MQGYRVPVTERDRTRVGLAIHLVAMATGVSPQQIASEQKHTGGVVRARRMAMYLAHVGYGWPLERVGHAFGRNRTTAAIACRWSEDERDKPAIDSLLDRLEACLRQMLDGEPLGAA